TIILFGIMFSCIALMYIFDRTKRSNPHKGFLPISTTRGDRFFLGIMFIVTIGLFWLRFIPTPILYAAVPALIAFIVVQIWG
ncbi:MAG: DUF2160 family membrane protein, partial [Candidatus Hodarchaeota archaeon]